MKIGRNLPNTVHQRTIEEKTLKLKFVLYFFIFQKWQKRFFDFKNSKKNVLQVSRFRV